LDSAPDPTDIALREAPLGSAARQSAVVPTAAPESDARRSPARVALRVLVRGAGIVAGVCVLALPLWIVAGAEYRPVILRMGAAAVLAIAALRILGDARRRIAEQAPSALDRAARPALPEASIPREYRDVAEELHFGRSSHGYWTRVLEPRLAALAARLPGAEPVGTPRRSRPRRLLGLGPDLRALRGAIERLERRR
jgi:hypothetical protein